VGWVVNEQPELLEWYLINALQLPLNLDQNKNHAFHRDLSEIRRLARRRAEAAPILT
jgi:hypothetical protein